LHRMAVREGKHELLDPCSELRSEVRRRRSDERVDVLFGRLRHPRKPNRAYPRTGAATYTRTSSGPKPSVNDPPAAVTVCSPSTLRRTRSASAGTGIVAVVDARLA